MITLKGLLSQDFEFKVDSVDVIDNLKKEFLQKINVSASAYIDSDGYWCETITYYTSHSFYTKNKIRKAEDWERLINNSFSLLKSFFVNKNVPEGKENEQSK